jgi:hypothetical protein
MSLLREAQKSHKSHKERLEEAEEAVRKETLSHVVSLYQSEIANSKSGRLKRGKMAEIIKSIGGEQFIKPYMVCNEVQRLSRLPKETLIIPPPPECNELNVPMEEGNVSSITTSTSTSTSNPMSSMSSKSTSQKSSIGKAEKKLYKQSLE